MSLENLRTGSKILSVINGKGGSGKTTSALALAACFGERLGKVLLVDADPQGSASWVTRGMGETNLFDLAQETNPQVLAKLREVANYGVIIVDTPPALDDATVSLVASLSDYLVLPASPSPLDLRELTRTIQAVIAPTQVPYRVLLCRVDTRRRIEALQIQNQLRSSGVRIFDTVIRSRVALERFIVEGVPLTQYPGARPSAEEYRKVLSQIQADLAPG